ncbi:hypothetical protein BSKO_08640 [Bryopsis sp. KO-2023]|nr:hypothetical protein BSKO_08640 [Bryopsis sp. KO-2023]
MAESGQMEVKEVLAKAGLVVSEKGNLTEVLCKPKLLPLKSITLEKLEQMERDIANLNARQASESAEAMGFGRPGTSHRQ